MSRREERLRVAIRQFLNEDPPSTAAEAKRFVEAAAYTVGVHIDRATAIFQEEVNAGWRGTH